MKLVEQHLIRKNDPPGKRREDTGSSVSVAV